MLKLKSKTVLFLGLLLTLMLSVNVNSQVPGPEQPESADLSFQPNNIPNVDVYYQDYSFVFEYKSFFIRVRPFIIYNETRYDMKQIVTWLKNNYPGVNYTWLVEKSEKIIHYGYNLTKLPQEIADKIDYLGFKLVDLNFPKSWITLEEVPKDGYNITLIYVEKANLHFSFEDLYPFGYSIEHLNSTHVLIGNVKGETDLIVDPVSYGAPVITVTGYSEGNDCAYWDLWNASYVNGWNVSDQLSENATYGIGFHNISYIFDCRLTIGDGSTLTWFADEGVTVIFLSQVGSDTIWIRNNATFRYGRLTNATTHLTDNGVVNIFDHHSYFGIRADSGSTVNIYSSLLTSWGQLLPTIKGATRIRLSNGSRVWETEFCKTSLTSPSVNLDLYRLTIKMANYGVQNVKGTTMNDVKIESCGSAIYTELTGDATLTGLNVVDISAFGYLVSTGSTWGADLNLINSVSTEWKFFFPGGSSGEVYQQYTFVANITDTSGSPLEGATVTVAHEGEGAGQDFSVQTGSNGSFSVRILTMNHYNRTGGDTPYQYGPYEITVSLAGYETLTFDFLMNEELNLILVLEERRSSNITFLMVGGVGGILIGLVMGLMLMKKRRIKE
jgi:hypothetical protein